MGILPNYNSGFRWEALFCHSGWLPGQWCCHLQKHGGWICPSHNKIWFQMDQRYPWGAVPLGCWGCSDGQGHQGAQGRTLDCSSRISTWCFAYDWGIDRQWSDQSTCHRGRSSRPVCKWPKQNPAAKERPCLRVSVCLAPNARNTTYPPLPVHPSWNISSENRWVKSCRVIFFFRGLETKISIWGFLP